MRIDLVVADSFVKWLEAAGLGWDPWGAESLPPILPCHRQAWREGKDPKMWAADRKRIKIVRS